LWRRRLRVTVAVLVKGSACSSQTCSRRHSVLRIEGLALSWASNTANSLTEVELVSFAGGGASYQVEFDARAQGSGPGGGAASGQGTDTKDEFGEVAAR
jgi:hypothetical protein